MRFLVVAALVLAARTAGAQGANFDLTRPIATVGFASGSADVRGDARDELQAAVTWLKDHPNRLLVIQGFADRAGSRGENMRLGADRADAVHAALLALGADPLRIVEVSYGEGDRPGRRVEVRGTVTEFPDIVRGQNPYVSPRTPLPAPPRRAPPRQRSAQPNT
jgi:hypothetical protein